VSAAGAVVSILPLKEPITQLTAVLFLQQPFEQDFRRTASETPIRNTTTEFINKPNRRCSDHLR